MMSINPSIPGFTPPFAQPVAVPGTVSTPDLVYYNVVHSAWTTSASPLVPQQQPQPFAPQTTGSWGTLPTSTSLAFAQPTATTPNLTPQGTPAQVNQAQFPQLFPAYQALPPMVGGMNPTLNTPLPVGVNPALSSNLEGVNVPKGSNFLVDLVKTAGSIIPLLPLFLGKKEETSSTKNSDKSVESLEEEIKASEKDLKELNESIASTDATIKNATTAVSDAETGVKTAEEARVSSNNELAAAKSRVASEKPEAKAAAEQALKKAEAKHTENTEAKAKADKTLKEAKDALAKEEAKLDKLRGERSELTTKKEALEKELEKAKKKEDTKEEEKEKPNLLTTIFKGLFS